MLEEISDLSHACLSLSLSLLPTCEPMLSLVLAYIGLACTVLPLGLYHVSSNLLALVVSAIVNASSFCIRKGF